jgi:hypothetical protein
MGFFHRYTIAADKAVQLAMLDKYAEFWETIKAETPPEPENYDDIKRLFPEPKGTLIVPEEIKGKLYEYRSLTSTSGEIKNRQEALKVEILSWARTQDTTIDDESMESIRFMDEAGNKIGSFSKQKNGKLVFRT